MNFEIGHALFHFSVPWEHMLWWSSSSIGALFSCGSTSSSVDGGGIVNRVTVFQDCCDEEQVSPTNSSDVYVFECSDHEDDDDPNKKFPVIGIVVVILLA